MVLTLFWLCFFHVDFGSKQADRNFCTVTLFIRINTKMWELLAWTNLISLCPIFQAHNFTCKTYWTHKNRCLKPMSD